MAFPICDNCARTGHLCEACQEKARRGGLSELEILVSSILARHGAAGFESIAELEQENKLVIFASEADAPRIIGAGGETVAELAKKLGRRVAVVSRSWDKMLIIKSLARPAKVVATTIVYRDGAEVAKLIFDKPLNEGTLELMKELAGDFEIGCQAPAGAVKH